MNVTSKYPFVFDSVLIILLLFSHVFGSMGSNSTIYPGQSLIGNQTLTSPRGVFEMGFFTPALKLLENGNLTFLSESKAAIWSTNSKSSVSNSTIDDENFVIKDAFDETLVIWQSFDHPTDTDAALGNETPTMMKIEMTGQFSQYYWIEYDRSWASIDIKTRRHCDAYCGSFGVCNPHKSPICACVEGFEPHETPKDVWELENITDGCVRKSRLLCASGADDEFVEVPDVLFPSYSEYLEA
ncbi:G-type lectin S-receptor-like serine/threonine-protein kinase [Morus notabilis]|uniref:G-type lectin S-receptor-like serine/threonine-protein kinase n=1 Tax=Morus notabilis TaxID=981085 RepID=W9QYM3_9ROSA|nr:G-type lectin S-receptor-like serine/threonine-protein kinase [Morus notabilis]